MAKRLCGSFNFLNMEVTDDSDNIVSYSSEEYSMMIMGEIHANNSINDPNCIYALYRQYHNNITAHITGLYILVICNKMNSTVDIYQDMNSSPCTLYYTYNNHTLFFSTSLKRLLLSSGIPRELNSDCVECFLLNGFVYGPETLIQHVFKIDLFHCLNAKDDSIIQNLVTYTITDFAEDQARNDFNETLFKAIIKQVQPDDTEINAILSSGYDSNYIVNTLSHFTGKPINAFTIGGKFGRNEIPLVEKNVPHFPNTKLFSSLVDSNSFKSLPDIVWRLEGSICQAGIFLQYELFKLVSKHNKHSLICGECADQVMNQAYFDERRNTLDPDAAKSKKLSIPDYPFVTGSLMILKKSGILANTFGIETRYPYLDMEFVSVCKPLAPYNGKHKIIHVENCKKNLPAAIIDNISKVNGTTESISLFNSKKEIRRFYREVEASKLYLQNKKLIKEFFEEDKKQSIIRNVKYLLRRVIYKKARNKQEEQKLRVYLNCKYLLLFENLFITGAYDSEFLRDSISSPEECL